MFDIIIKNGTLIDGSGAEPYISSIGIKDGIIVKIARSQELLGEAKTVINADGLTVTPGFIDSHSHSDNTPFFFLITANNTTAAAKTTTAPAIQPISEPPSAPSSG